MLGRAVRPSGEGPAPRALCAKGRGSAGLLFQKRCEGRHKGTPLMLQPPLLHTYAHTYIPTYTICINTDTCTHTQTPAHKRQHTDRYIHRHTHKHLHTNTCKNSYAYTPLSNPKFYPTRSPYGLSPYITSYKPFHRLRNRARDVGPSN